MTHTASSMTAPLVSVVMPVYNQKDYVIESLASVCAQDYCNMEILIIDDCSKDATALLVADFIAKYQGKHSIRFHKSEVNQGISKSINFLIDQARGKYVSFFAGDDLMFNGKISVQVNHMERHPECAISYHDVDVFDTAKENHLYYFSQRHAPRSGDYRVLIRYQTFNCGCSNMVRMAFPIHCDETIKNASDWLQFVDILCANQGEIQYIDRVLGGYRRHMSNITKTDSMSAYKEVMRTFDQMVKRYPKDKALINKVKAERMMSYGIKFIVEKRIVLGMATFGRGFFKNPTSVVLVIHNLAKYISTKR